MADDAHGSPATSPKTTALPWIAGAAFALFAVVASSVATGNRPPLDRAVFAQLYASESPWPLGATPGQDNGALQALLPVLYRVADARKFVLLVVLIVTILLALRLFRAVAFFAAAISIAVLVPILKPVFDRPSPFPRADDPAFPSGHALASMAIAGALVSLVANTRWRWPAVAVATLFVVGVGVAVIADGGHWPSDVVASWLLAAGWLCLLRLVFPDPLGSRAETGAMPRAWAREGVSFAIRWSGIAPAVRSTVARRRASILLYHDPTPAVLEAHFRYLADRYNFVSLSDLVDALGNGSWDSLPDRPLVVTFDDGHQGNADLLPLFARYNVVPTVYLCSQIVDTRRRYWFLEADDPEPLKPLDTAERIAVLARTGFEPAKEYPDNGRQALSHAELAVMAPQVEFASHTRFHPILTTTSDPECADEILASKSELEALLGQECLHFSYPNGDYSPREIELLRAAGYRSGRTVDLGWNGPRTDVYRLKILGTEDDASVNRLAADLTGIPGYLTRLSRGSFRGRHVQVRRAR